MNQYCSTWGWLNNLLKNNQDQIEHSACQVYFLNVFIDIAECFSYYVLLCVGCFKIPISKYERISALLFLLKKYTFQELKRETAKAALAMKTLQEKMEEKLKVELEQKVHI